MRLQLVLAGVLSFTVFSVACQPVATDLERLLEYRRLGNAQIAPDGRRVVFVAESNDLEANTVSKDLWLAETAKPGAQQRLTSTTEQELAPAWSPDGKRIAFIRSHAGRRQLLTMTADGGKTREAIPLTGLRISEFRWLPDGNGFLFLATPRPAHAQGRQRPSGARPGPPLTPKVAGTHPGYQHLYIYRTGTAGPERLSDDNDHVTTLNVSADGRRVVMSTRSRPGHPFSGETQLKLLDIASAKIKSLFTQPTPVDAPAFSADGKWIAFISRENPGHDVLHNACLQVVRINGTERRTLGQAVDENVMGYHWRGDSKSIVFWVFAGVRHRAYQVTLTDDRVKMLDAFEDDWVLGKGSGISYSADGVYAALTISNTETPEEVYVLDADGKNLRRLTSLNQDFTGLAPETELIKYRSRDGMLIEALLKKPRHYDASRRYPLLVLVHGGPPLVFTKTFFPRLGNVYPVFAFADAGFVQLLPNPRGSTGYGERFRRANIKDLGGGDFQDIMAGVDKLVADGIADPERMGIMGWSYGGQMSYWALTHTDRFRAVSAGAGISNLLSHHGTGQARGYGQHDAYFGTTPWQDPQLYIKNSPLFYINNANTPLLIQHVENDPIVPVSQAQELYSAALRTGLNVEMIIYPGQSHVIHTPLLLLDAMQRNLNWFQKWLQED